MNRTDIEFTTSDGTTLRGWYYQPDAESPWPVIVMSHGFGAVKEMQLDIFAEAFVDAGVACFVYDQRNIGASDGKPRQELDPFMQISDGRDAITTVQTLDDVDDDRIGIWGTSYSGGHVLVLAATDRRVGCVVSQVPTISGWQNTLRRFPGEELDEMRTQFIEDRIARDQGEDPETVPLAEDLTDGEFNQSDTDPTEVKIGNSVRNWCAATPSERLENWKNSVTLRSHELYSTYEPGSYIERIAPTPLLMISMDHDTITPTDQILGAYERAREPKQLKLLPGGHADVYGRQRDAAATAACDWFQEHL